MDLPNPYRKERITNVLMRCPKCGLIESVGECEPDVDGDGNLGCPKCNEIVEQIGRG